MYKVKGRDISAAYVQQSASNTREWGGFLRYGVWHLINILKQIFLTIRRCKLTVRPFISATSSGFAPVRKRMSHVLLSSTFQRRPKQPIHTQLVCHCRVLFFFTSMCTLDSTKQVRAQKYSELYKQRHRRITYTNITLTEKQKMKYEQESTCVQLLCVQLLALKINIYNLRSSLDRIIPLKSFVCGTKKAGGGGAIWQIPPSQKVKIFHVSWSLSYRQH